MSQTTYSLDPTKALPGMLGDGDDYQIESYPCSEAIPPGRMVELAAGKVRLAQGTGQSIASPVGVSVYGDAMPPGGYQINDMVPCLRRGKIYADFSGSTIADLADARVKHSSTIATDRGKFTDAAASAVAGSEVSDNLAKFRRDPAVSNVCLVELNLP